MQPTDTYFKSKRSLVLFSFIMLLIIFGGITVEPSDQTIHGIKLQIGQNFYFDYVVFFVCLYSLFQFSLFWLVQNSEVRSRLHFRIDFFASSIIGVIATLVFCVTKFDEWFGAAARYHAAWWLIGSVFIVIYALVFYLAYRLFVKLVMFFRLKAKRVESKILDQLLEKEWRLVFNPKSQSRGSKTITFNEDFTIGKGRNNNENTWRSSSDFLELIDGSGEVFSRFRFDQANEVFRHTNDEDTRSLKDQLIEPLSPK